MGLKKPYLKKKTLMALETSCPYGNGKSHEKWPPCLSLPLEGKHHRKSSDRAFYNQSGFISDWYEEFVLDTAPRINTKFFFLLQKESFLDVKRKGEREDIKWQNAIFSVLRSYLEINTIALVAQVLQSHLQKNRLRRFGWDVSSDVHFESKDVSSDLVLHRSEERR